MIVVWSTAQTAIFHRMSADATFFSRFEDLQRYVGWTERDVVQVRQVAAAIEAELPALIDDFYAELQRHPDTIRVITGGPAQIERLKGSLREWLRDSLRGRYDAEYVGRRWSIGLRHAEIGLHPAYTNAALARLRNGILRIVSRLENIDVAERDEVAQSLNRLLDLDLAIIQDAYEAAHVEKEKLFEHERSEVKFRMLVEAAACLVLIVDERRRILYCSPYGRELTGHAVESLVGCDLLDTLIAAAAHEDVARDLASALADKPLRGQEHPIIRSDGRERWLVWNTQRLADFNGAAAVLLVGHDFTEKREAHERMLRAERLAGIGQMITGLAHESRNALQRIQACSEMLELELEQNDEAMRLVHRLQNAQDDLRRLLDEVRNFAAPIQLERSECDVAHVWREAWQLLETERRGRDATMEENLHGVGVRLVADRFRLVQLFRNMMENSLAACGDPVRIRLECREVTHDDLPALEISVRDNGPGLSPDAAQSVFEPFFTTKTRGTGLGMAIARRIVDAHGGRIETGTSSSGAEFIITLPKCQP